MPQILTFSVEFLDLGLARRHDVRSGEGRRLCKSTGDDVSTEAAFHSVHHPSPSRRARQRCRVRRVVVAVCAVFGAAVVAVGCGSSGAATSSGAVTLGSGTVDLSSVTLHFGDQNQLMKEVFASSGQLAGAKYKVTFDQFTDGPHMDAAFAAHRIDAGYMGDTPALFANAAHAGVSVLATGIAGGNGGVYALLARPGSGIHSAADLKGKRVGFTRRTALEGWIIGVLKTQGLTEHDIKPVDLPILSLVSALSSGQLDAVVGVAPGSQTYLQSHPGAGITPPRVPVYLVVLGSNASLRDASMEAALEDFVNRLTRAEAWVQGHATQFITDYYVNTLHVPPSIAQSLYSLNGNLRIVPVAQSGLQHALDVQHSEFVDLGSLPSDPPVSNLFPSVVTQRYDPIVAAASRSGAGQ